MIEISNTRLSTERTIGEHLPPIVGFDLMENFVSDAHADAPHMNAALPKVYFDDLGLVSLFDLLRSHITTSPLGTTVVPPPS